MGWGAGTVTLGLLLDPSYLASSSKSLFMSGCWHLLTVFLCYKLQMFLEDFKSILKQVSGSYFLSEPTVIQMHLTLGMWVNWWRGPWELQAQILLAGNKIMCTAHVEYMALSAERKLWDAKLLMGFSICVFHGLPNRQSSTLSDYLQNQSYT